MGAAGAIAQGAGVAMQAGQAINSGIKGNRAANQLNEAQTQADRRYDAIWDTGQGMIGGVQDMIGGAIGGVQGGPQNNVNIPGVTTDPSQMNFQAPGMNQFNFDQVGQVADQAVQNALDAGTRARAGARDNVAQQTAQFQDNLAASLAGQGMSRNSGAAATALQGNAMNAANQMVGLERGIADAAQAAGLQGAQFDAQNALQMGQMGSQYNLGMNQLGQQSALNQFNANLGAQQQGFGQNMANAQLQAGIDSAANQYNLGAANIGLQGAGQMGSILQGLLGTAAGGFEAGLDRRAKGAQQAGAGKGAATGGAAAGLQNMTGSKGAGPVGNVPSNWGATTAPMPSYPGQL